MKNGVNVFGFLCISQQKLNSSFPAFVPDNCVIVIIVYNSKPIQT
jgi:hypothetical protein